MPRWLVPLLIAVATAAIIGIGSTLWSHEGRVSTIEGKVDIILGLVKDTNKRLQE